MHYVICPECQTQAEVSPDAVGPERTWLFNVTYCDEYREGKKAIWTLIGSAWAHSDGEGFNIQLDAHPVDGKVTLRVRTEKEE